MMRIEGSGVSATRFSFTATVYSTNSHSIARLARQQADAIQDPEVLRRLTVKISVVKTMIDIIILTIK